MKWSGTNMFNFLHAFTGKTVTVEPDYYNSAVTNKRIYRDQQGNTYEQDNGTFNRVNVWGSGTTTKDWSHNTWGFGA